ncbi:MAG: hypothetical protein HPY30_06410 [Gammaproteobacteria bacterium (ex Lamellibrachia satsuma)]|nr:MAG: hypothetical protein HPY30_06410 [Gammaproteobacteria bacterium (ex Lamellibrachia satsuma)]
MSGDLALVFGRCCSGVCFLSVLDGFVSLRDGFSNGASAPLRQVTFLFTKKKSDSSCRTKSVLSEKEENYDKVGEATLENHRVATHKHQKTTGITTDFKVENHSNTRLSR